MSKGRIVEVERVEHRAIYLKQGVKKRDQWKYSNYPGGYGTYVTGGEYLGTSLNVKIFVYDLNRCCTFDVRDAVLEANGKKKVSKKLLNFLKQNEGKKVKVSIGKNEVSFHPDNLPYFKMD